MGTHAKQDSFEKKVKAMEKGFSTFPNPNAQLRFRREDLTPGQVVQRLQSIGDAIQAVREAEAKHREAVKAYAKAMPKDHAFYEEAVAVVKSHFGSDAHLMATFGLRAHRTEHHRLPEVVIIEEVVEVPERGRRAPTVEVEETVEGSGPLLPTWMRVRAGLQLL
jgi:hypothetical protein